MHLKYSVLREFKKNLKDAYLLCCYILYVTKIASLKNYGELSFEKLKSETWRTFVLQQKY